MRLRKFLKRTTGLLGTLALLSNASVSLAQDNGSRDDWWPQDGFRHGEGWRGDDHHDGLSLKEKVELLRRKVKYVFVIFHENESFDHYFGTFPGARGSTTCRGAPSCRAVTVAGASHAGRGRSEPYGQVNARKIDGECHKNYLSYSIVPVG